MLLLKQMAKNFFILDAVFFASSSSQLGIASERIFLLFVIPRGRRPPATVLLSPSPSVGASGAALRMEITSQIFTQPSHIYIQTQIHQHSLSLVE